MKDNCMIAVGFRTGLYSFNYFHLQSLIHMVTDAKTAFDKHGA